MGFKDALAKKYADAYLTKYGDRITQVQGRILSIKTTTSTKLFFHHFITVDILVKPEKSKNITRCQYIKKRWFKKPTFMQLNQGHSVVIQGVKGKKGKEDSELITILNVMNFTTKQDLVPTGQPQSERVKKQIIRK
jgi:murein L,D-transpeptidase YafK